MQCGVVVQRSLGLYILCHCGPQQAVALALPQARSRDRVHPVLEFCRAGDQKSPAWIFYGWYDACLRRYLIESNYFIEDGQGQNRTADTGIFRQ